MKCYLINIKGEIRGNSFRSSAMHAALQFRITGFIRYDAENSLTIEAQGELNDINQFVQFCRDWFSPDIIKDFTVNEKEPENYPGFTIRQNISAEDKITNKQRWMLKIKDMIRP